MNDRLDQPESPSAQDPPDRAPDSDRSLQSDHEVQAKGPTDTRLPDTQLPDAGEEPADQPIGETAPEQVDGAPGLVEEAKPLLVQDSPAEGQTPKTEPIIRLIDVNKSFGSLHVLNNISLEFERGQVTVIVGPSGVGKSVILKHIGGLIKPDSGQVWFEDKRVDQMKESQLVQVRKKIGYLFQMGALFDSMNVGDNICFPLVEHAQSTAAERRHRCAHVLNMVGLPDIENKMPAELSGGQKKRVALARAIVLEPEVVLYDEPTTGLDPIRADLINELILSLDERLGITSIVVTHDMNSAYRIADRMVMIHEGQIVADGNADHFEQSNEQIVRRFVRGEADQDDLDRIRGGFKSRNDI